MRRTSHRRLVNGGILSGRIPLISLVQFIAVAEHLNFRHAAKALGVSQSSVSARVKVLEENLGVLLFERHVRSGLRVWLLEQVEADGRAGFELVVARALRMGPAQGARPRGAAPPERVA